MLPWRNHLKKSKRNSDVDILQASEEEAMRGFKVQRTTCRDVQCPEQLLYYLGKHSSQSKSLQKQAQTASTAG